MLTEAALRGYHLSASVQVLRGCLAMSTGPVESKGLGLSFPDVVANIDQFLRFVTLFDGTESGALRLRELVMTRSVRGNRIHDANIAATMMVHHIRVLVTQNLDDFAPFDEIEALPPDRVVLNSGT